jgi:glutamine synthetase
MMDLAESITAFGNTNPISYFRLVPNQEAPTSVCWGDRNRSVLVRVPLGWTGDVDMSAIANPGEQSDVSEAEGKQTVEIRSADGSANIYLLLASLAVACRHGFEMADAAEVAERCYVDVNIHKQENQEKLSKLAQLPDSCEASAECLKRQRNVYEEYGVFTPSMINATIEKLASYADKTLREDIKNDPEALEELVKRYFHCG